jgi:hypothetical protein
MIQYNITSVLPFYKDIALQNHRRSYAYGDVYPLYTPSGQILPFQFLTPHDATNQVGYAYLKKIDGTMVADILQPLTDGGLRVTQYASDGYDIISYPSIMPLGINMLEGQYYIELVSIVGRYYSEVFTVVGDISPYLKIEWRMREDLISYGWRIQYNSGLYAFRNVVYLATELGKPDYEFEETGESRDGWFFPEKMISEKSYKFQFMAPEYLCDAMRFVRMADEIKVTDKYGRTYLCDQFLMTPKWQEQGNLASVEAEFQTDTVAKAIGRALTPNDLASFNNDYNADYDITETT